MTSKLRSTSFFTNAWSWSQTFLIAARFTEYFSRQSNREFSLSNSFYKNVIFLFFDNKTFLLSWEYEKSSAKASMWIFPGTLGVGYLYKRKISTKYQATKGWWSSLKLHKQESIHVFGTGPVPKLYTVSLSNIGYPISIPSPNIKEGGIAGWNWRKKSSCNQRFRPFYSS